MVEAFTNQYSAGQQGLEYIHQPCAALLRLLQLRANPSVLIEMGDDVDFVDQDGIKVLTSLKHQAADDRSTGLSTDVSKPLRIGLTRCDRNGRSEASLRFFLFMIDTVSKSSGLQHFLLDQPPNGGEVVSFSKLACDVITATEPKLVSPSLLNTDLIAQVHRNIN